MPHVVLSSTSYEVYAKVITANLFLQADARLNAIWSAATDDDKVRALITATRLVNRQSWRGTANPSGIGLLTFIANPLNAETVTIDAKTYTFQTTLTDVDGNVLIGVDVAASLANLLAAINLADGSGVAYAAATTLHPTVSAESVSTTILQVTSNTAGETALSIVTTETLSGASWGADTLTQSILAWPRSNVTDATGVVVDSNAIPLQITQGVMTLAALIVENAGVAEASDTGSNIEQVRAGSVSVTFFRPTVGSRFPQVVQELFGSFLSSANVGRGGSVAFGATSESTTPKSNSFGTDYGLNEGLS